MLKLLLILVITIVSLICYADPFKEIKVVVFETNQGTFELELYPEVAPKLVANFVKLANDGFFDGTYFHRVIPDFMIQGGDPNTKDGNRANDGSGGPDYRLNDEISAKALGLADTKIKNTPMGNQYPANHPVQEMTMKEVLEQQGYSFNEELPSLKNLYGHLSMANAGPNTNGSQFFIITKKDGASWLDGKHTVLGKIVSGMDVVHKIENLPRDNRDNPLADNQAIVQKVFVK